MSLIDDDRKYVQTFKQKKKIGSFEINKRLEKISSTRKTVNIFGTTNPFFLFPTFLGERGKEKEYRAQFVPKIINLKTIECIKS